MKFFASKRTQRLTNFALAAMLVVSTLTASVPFLFSQKAKADAGYNVRVTAECVNNLVTLKVLGNNPNNGQSAVWVKSSANFQLSAPVLAQPGVNDIAVPLATGQGSIPAGGVTMYISPTQDGQYTLLDDPSARASFDAIDCNDYSNVYVAQNGLDTNNGTYAATPYATIQKALDTVGANGTVNIADGSYTGTAVIKKSGTKLVGTSGNRDAVEIHVVNNGSGQGGVYADSLNNITIQNLAVIGTPQFTNGGLIKISNGTNATISNVVVKSGHIIDPSVARTNTSGININGYTDVNVDNVYVAGLGKDGISIVGQQNGSVVTKNVALNNISVAGSGWSNLAFYTKDASITGVTLNSVRLQYGDRGLYIDGSNSAGVANQNTVTGVNGGILQLNNTLIKNINNEYINNEQTGDVNASGISVDSQNRPVYVDTLAVKDLTPAELTNLRNNFIKDKSHKNGLVTTYGTVFIQGPAAPTNLSPNGWTSSFTKFAWTGAVDASTYNVRYSRTHPNNVADNLQTGITGTQYVLTLADGPLFWQVQSVDAAGNVGPWSDMGYATIDTTAPTSTNDLAGLVRGTVTITQTVNDNIQSKSGKIRIWKQNTDGTLNDSKFFAIGDVNVDSNNKVIYTVNTLTNLYGDGTYTAKFTATDVLGHTSTVEKVFVVDNTKPVISSITGADEGSFRNTSTTPRFYITDTSASTYTYKIERNGVVTNTGNGSLAAGNSVLAQLPKVASPAVYKVTFTVTDAAGNVEEVVRNFTIDTTIPTAQITFPARGMSATNFTVSFNEPVNVADAKNPANYYLQNWPGAGSDGDLLGDATIDYNATTKVATVAFTNPFWYVSGEQKWGVKNIHDLAGNSIVDTSAYSTPLTAPTAPGNPTTVTPAKSLTTSWTWTAATDLPTPAEDASGIKGYEYTLTAHNVAATSWTFTADTSATTTASSDGTYDLHVRALDKAGSPAGPESIGTVLIDTAAPVPTITSPDNGTTVGNNAKVTIAGSVVEANGYTYTLSIGKTGQAPVKEVTGSNFTSYTWDTTGVVSDNYIATLTATDAAGNPSEVNAAVVIAVDNTAPNLDIAPQTNTDGNQPTITGTVNDSSATLLVTFNGTDYAVANNRGTFSFTAPAALANGTYSFAITATDVNGNQSSRAANVVVAVIPPATTPATTVTPIITNPASAVLGATTDNTNTGDAGVKGTSDDKTASAANSDANKGTIFGLAWYWWILILAALAAIAWFIIAAIRRRNEEQA